MLTFMDGFIFAAGMTGFGLLLSLVIGFSAGIAAFIASD